MSSNSTAADQSAERTNHAKRAKRTLSSGSERSWDKSSPGTDDRGPTRAHGPNPYRPRRPNNWRAGTVVATVRSLAVAVTIDNRQRLRYVAVLTLVAGMLSSCTVVGVVISPITGPVDAVRAAVEGDIPVAKVWVVPFLVVLSPIGGLVSGIMVDEAVVAQGRWDVIPAILRPWNTIATSLPPLTAEPASK